MYSFIFWTKEHKLKCKTQMVPKISSEKPSFLPGLPAILFPEVKQL